MAQKTLFRRLKAVASLAPVAVTAAVNGAGVDTQGYDSVDFLVDLGIFAGSAAPTATIQLQDSDDNSTFAVVPANLLMNAAWTGNIVPNGGSAVGVQQVGYTGLRRYVRGAVTAVTGTTPSLPSAITVLLGAKRHGPAN